MAAWCNKLGVAGVILKYRVPRGTGEPMDAFLDGQRAVSIVRSRAAEWGIDPQRIGMIGFSAGGHLVGATATNFEKRAYEPIDAIDKISCRPDFGVMAYSGYFMLKDAGGMPAHGNQRSAWEAGCRFDFPNLEHR